MEAVCGCRWERARWVTRARFGVVRVAAVLLHSPEGAYHCEAGVVCESVDPRQVRPAGEAEWVDRAPLRETRFAGGPRRATGAWGGFVDRAYCL